MKKYLSEALIREQYRMLRTNIYFSSSEEVKVIVVTSPEKSDGKSTTAINLAKTLVADNFSVLLLDCDLRKPSINKRLNLSNHKGLTNIIVNNDDIHEVIHKDVEIEGFDVITSGVIPPNPSEILHSDHFKELLVTFKKCYNYIIIDTPPVLAATDSVLAAKNADGVLLVLSSKKSNKHVAKKAVNSLSMAQVRILGAVLNKMDFKSEPYYEYYMDTTDKQKSKIVAGL
ncbi:CpsD/CapB family tyrosine-protein kinase [Vallitalea okinawensis]|uniref:CpsD/CapB family tyrosine-protein kinase n=1 Tax=Vallitalea okinawensis TaxID=2078660 RepID=UPI000CFB911A|nr:CpsD/CapB family tyrosine-protein kinase [Vallitalea okinawensis]